MPSPQEHEDPQVREYFSQLARLKVQLSLATHHPGHEDVVDKSVSVSHQDGRPEGAGHQDQAMGPETRWLSVRSKF
jgi:hypothetical protein